MRPTADVAERDAERIEFASFYVRKRDPVFRSILLITRDVSRAEDSVQEAFTRALSDWQRLRTHPNPTGWVVRVALNHATSWWRIGRRERPEPPDRPATPDEHPIDDDLLRLVWALPRRQRQVVALRILLDQSTEETARLLHIAPGTVTAHLHRAMTQLRERLGRDQA